MKISLASARVAFAIHLEGALSAAADVARIQHVVHLFRGHHLPATWSIAGRDSLELLQHKGLLQDGDELALAVSSDSSMTVSQFRDTLRGRLAMIQASTGTTIQLAAGEPSTLRNHAAILAEQGIHGILSNTRKLAAAPSHSPLPCGLWQLDYAISIPLKSWFTRVLPGGSALHQLNKLISKDQTVLITVDAAHFAHASTRSLQSLEKLLRQVSHAASREEIAITTAGEIVAELTASRVARPQHSILRAA